MSIKRLVPLNLPALDDLPASGSIGDLVYYTVDDTVYVYDGTSWNVASGSGGGAGTITSVTAGTGLSGGGTSGDITLSVDSSVAILTGTQTLTNKTISGTDNTLSNIPQSAVTSLSTDLSGKQPLDGDLTAIAAISGTSGLLKKTAANTWSLDTSTYLTGNQTITVSGDATGSGTTGIALTLANSGVTAGTYNNVASQVRPFTVDAKGRVTSVGTAVNIAIAQSAVANLTTDLAAKAPLASPTFTGTPAAPTATSGTNTTQIATTAFVQTAVSDLINGAPGALNTLDELAAALGDDANFASTVTNSLAGKQPLDADLTAIAGLAGTSGLLKKTAADTWTLDTSTYLTGNQTITLTGDASGSGTTSIAVTVANDSHSHSNSTITSLDAGKISSGTLPVARGGTGTTSSTGSGNLVLATTPTITTPVISGEMTMATSTKNVGGVGDWTLRVQDGMGRINYYWNTYGGTSPTLQTANEDAFRLNMTVDGPVMSFSGYDGSSSAAGTAITWTEVFRASMTEASPYFKGSVIWHAGNDGASSGLDADLLDGQHGSYYLDWTNVSNKPDPTITLAGDLSGSITLTDLGGGTLTATVADDSHNHVISNVDGLQTALDGKAATSHDHNTLYVALEAANKDDITTRTQSGAYQTSSATAGEGWPETTNTWYHLLTSTHSNTANYYSMQFAGSFYDSNSLFYRATNGSGTTGWNRIWHAGNDGAGSGLDADLLDGYQTSTSGTANTIALRNSSGDLYGRYVFGQYLNMSHGVTTRNADTVFYSSTDSYIRKNNAGGFKKSLALDHVENIHPFLLAGM